MDYFSDQPEINENMRSIVIDWLVDITNEYHLRMNTLYSAVMLMDKYLSMEKITRNNFQAVAVSCLYIASKTEEVYSPELSSFVHSTDNAYTKSHLLKTEYDILNKLNYKVYNDTIVQYIEIAYQCKNIDKDTYFFCLYIATITLMTIDYNFVKPDNLAKKIIDFYLILKMEPKIMETLINSDPIYCYLYLTWIKIKESEYKSINTMFADNEVNKVSTKEIPIINCMYDKNTFVLRSVWNEIPMEIEELNFKIYSDSDIQNFITISELGSGTYGIVKHVKISDNDLAIKRIRDDDVGNGIGSYMLREINTLQNLNHPNIIKMHGFNYNPNMGRLIIGFEFMKCTLRQGMREFTNNEKMKGNFIIGLLRGLEHIHSKNIVHRDISANNILLSMSGVVKIADFGSSRYFRHPQHIASYTGEVCTLWYRPIELLFQKMPYSQMIDIWSAACIIGYILSGQDLFPGDCEIDMIHRIFRVLGTPTENFCSEICSWPNFRTNFPIWPRKGFVDIEKKYPEQTKILYKMFEYDPVKRISANQALIEFMEIYGGSTS
ncbi:cyclin domain fused to cyclin-dependent serine/threonine protein kinase [Tupanvirus soda lake]|uniref:cyclin-dependent kinase n=2 Tax=Tupanvirus TaxID=2094720 RepID=A0A6N1NJE9_9VIRU|nr:cyclin domain fused to cyclin-dependent serine/threonine protein kinase [Tupanvirus soda lake]QKU35004.1 cyclin domain fused to cyclin-dependent serine/threonine protein kinase [Tupanvirus soda lake]